MFSQSKKAQFYIISAVIIIFIILSLTAVSNYASIKKQPEKLLQLSDVLKTESRYILENAEYNQGNLNQNIEAYVELFSNYIDQTTNEDFNMTIIYGGIHDNTISGFEITRNSLGNDVLDLGGSRTGVSAGNQVLVSQKEIHIDSVSSTKTANITITWGNNTLTRMVPILEDNNFIFVMTTNDGFNQYVRESFPQIQT